MRVGKLKIKAQLYCGDELAMGPGKADLLEAIDREGSISAAGRAMGMSYRRSWLLVDSMNRCWQEKLVETVAGGGHGRGASLTSTGHVGLAAGFPAAGRGMQIVRLAGPEIRDLK